MVIKVNLPVILAERNMGVGEFAELVGISQPNLSVLKNGRAKAIRFSTLDAICRALNCQPGAILPWEDDD